MTMKKQNWNYKMSKKMIMKNAHRIARSINTSIGCYAISYKVALKYVWKSVKTYNKRSFGDMAFDNAVAKIEQATSLFNDEGRYFDGIPAWILRKNLNGYDYDAVLSNFLRTEVIRETEKAIDFRIVTELGSTFCWVPKSIIDHNYKETVKTNDIFDEFVA